MMIDELTALIAEADRRSSGGGVTVTLTSIADPAHQRGALYGTVEWERRHGYHRSGRTFHSVAELRGILERIGK
jgi:hypothetical protein